MRTIRSPLTATATTLAAAGLLACGSADSSPAKTTGAAGGWGSASVSATAHAAASTTRVSAARRALATARKAVRHGRPYDLERDRFRGKSVWEVNVASGSQRPYEVLVSANGRKVVHRHRDDHRSDDATKGRHAKVGFRRALRIAARRGSGALSEAEIDRDRSGRIVWTATFKRSGGAETEVAVDARTAKVVSVRHESDDD